MDASSVIRQLRTPQGTADPYPLYAAARAAGPVLRDATYTLVTTYAHADLVLRSPYFAAAAQTSHAEAAKIAEAAPAPEDSSAPAVSVLRANGPGHTRMRKALSPSFQRPRIHALRSRIERCAAQLLAPVLAEPGVFEFMDTVGYRLPIAVISELLGVPEADRPRLRAFARARTIFLEPMPTRAQFDAAEAARGEVFALFDRLVRRRRADPGDDLVSELLRHVDDAGEPGARLSEAELFVNLSLLLIAGFETTAGLLGNAVALLLERPDVCEALRADEELIPAFVAEVLRHDPPVHLVTRTATDGRAEIGGVPLAAGDLVMVLIGSANRDPARYPDPDVFAPFTRVPRPPAHGLAFGAGPHFCLGAGLAQVEAEILVRELVGARRRLLPAGPGARTPGRIAIRSFASLPVRVAAAA